MKPRETPRDLSNAEKDELEAAGCKPDIIESNAAARRSPRKRKRYPFPKGLPQLIALHAAELISDAGGVRLFSRDEVGGWLVERGLLPPLNRFTKVGNALAVYGLNLPFATYRCCRYFDLSAVSMTAEEKTARHANLQAMGADIIRQLFGIASDETA